MQIPDSTSDLKMLRPNRRHVVVLVSMLLWGTGASARSGSGDFRHYCAACHGQSGKGGGSWNGTKVPDLTRLSHANGGKFPTDEVIAIVDGRSRILWHQRQPGEMMPYWGDVFHAEEEQLGKAKAESRIIAIVDYIRSIQEK
jgi:Cytochrome C oxidase, cbb3-type, subunit III